MNNKTNIEVLATKLCELKLEERRVCSDIKSLVNQKRTIDFFAAQQLSSQRKSLQKNIKSVQAKIMPNIIA
ncbi:MAG: hypothetical protein R3Y43_03295 [Alphaproteobacteria bacterium]